jgi:hypothetical protein
MHLKSYSKKPFMKNWKNSQIDISFWNNFFRVHFVTKVSLQFWNLRKILHF